MLSNSKVTSAVFSLLLGANAVMMPTRKIPLPLAIVFIAMLVLAEPSRVAAQAEASQQAASSTSKVKTVGTIKSISGNTVTLATDSGSEVTVLLPIVYSAASHGSRANGPEASDANSVAGFAGWRSTASWREQH